MLSAEPAKNLKCRIPADTDAAIRISQVLQLASLVQVAQQQVQHLQPKLWPRLHDLPCSCHIVFQICSVLRGCCTIVNLQDV